MSRFESMIQIMRRDVCSPKHRRRFGEFRHRHALEAKDMPALLATLAQRDRTTYAHRETLTRALLTEYQSRPSSLWSSALIVAYGPMLLRLRNRIMTTDMPADDLDQMVFETFLGVARHLRLDDPRGRLPMFLRELTHRTIFRLLGREASYQEMLGDLEDHPDMLVGRCVGEGGPAPDAGIEYDDLVMLLVAEVGRDLLADVVLNGDGLERHAQEVTPSNDEHEVRRIYDRVRQRRSRAVRRLRVAASNARRGPR